MSNLSPRARAERAAARFLNKPKRATLGWQKSATEIVVAAPGGLGRVYITWTDTHTRATATNRGVPLAPALPILVQEGAPNLIVDIDYSDMAAVAVALNNEYGVPGHPLVAHSDVTIAAAASGDVLAHNGTDWVDEAPITATAGAGDAGKLIRLDSNGVIDASMYTAGFTQEEIEDFTAAQFTGNTGIIDATYDDGTGAITLTLDVSAADKFLYSTGADTWAEGDISAFGRSLIDDADQATARTTLGITAYNQETVEDFVGAMVAGNTETGITVTYDDSTGKLNFVVAAQDHGALLGLTDDDHSQYLLLAGRSGGQRVTGIASTGYALEVYRNLASGSTDSAVMAVTQDHASDDQAALRVQQDGSGNVLEAYQGANLIAKIAGSAVASSLAVDASALATTSFANLAIFGNVGSYQFVMFNSTRAGTSFGTNDAGAGRLRADSVTSFKIGTDDTAPLILGTNGTEAIYINSNQQVGIGLTSFNANRLGMKAGGSSNDAAVGGVLYVTTTQTGNVGTGEDDLASYSVPANTLSANGMSIWFEAWGTIGVAFGAKQIRVRFGASGTNVVVDTTSVAFGVGTNPNWRIVGRIVRTGAATQKATAEVSGGIVGAGVYGITSLNQTLSGAVTLKITAEAISNNDVVIESFIVGFDDTNT